jgi:hypothetical protein
LSSGCPHHFTSGANELGETGWWKLTTMKPPYVKKGQNFSKELVFEILKLSYASRFMNYTCRCSTRYRHEFVILPFIMPSL